MQNLPNVASDTQSERAVEVVGMLGDSVVSVNHIESTDNAPSKRSAHGLLIAAAILLAVSAFAFIKGIAAASANKAALEHFRNTMTDIPLHHFRPPHELGWIYDWMAFGGLAGGILAAGFGLALLRRKRAVSSFTVGNGIDATYSTADLGADRFELVRTSDTGTILNLTDAMSGQINQGGVSLPLDNISSSSMAVPSATKPGVYELALPIDASARIETGKSRFLVRSVPADRSRIDSLFGQLDRRAAKFFGASAVAHLALIAFLGTIPPDPRSLALNNDTTELRHVRYSSKAFENEREKLTSNGSNDNNGPDGSGMTLPGEEGLAGTPDSSNANARRTIANRGGDHLARANAMTMARNSGVAGALRATSAFRSMTSYANFASGYDDYDNIGGLDGEPGSQRGTFGMGRDGNGIGTGHWSLVYSNNYRTIGGPGPNKYPGWGPKGPGHTNKWRKKSKHVPAPPKFDVNAEGGLDRAIVRRYLRRQRARFQHCYERELQVKPNLRGSVKVAFIISGNGSVLSARANGMSNHTVVNCVRNVVERIKFPRSSDGSTVSVNYAIHFAPAGG